MNAAQRLASDGYAGVRPVLFYHQDGEWGCFSNFSEHPVILINPWTNEYEEYSTGEHRFQAMKALSKNAHDYVNAAEYPAGAKHRGGPKGIDLRPDWGDTHNSVCYFVMFEVVLAKALLHPDVMDTLADTGERPIYEDSVKDDIWGWRYHEAYLGKNLLGRCWMQVRDLLL